MTDARGRPVDPSLTGGQVSDFAPAAVLLEGEFGAAIIADRGHDGDRVVSLVEAQGGRAVIPPRSRWSGRREFDRGLHRPRHRIAARHEKLAARHLGMVQLASALVRLEA